MASFGRADHDLLPDALALPWLAGLLEAEGSFLKPPPSAPHSPLVVCRMTDLDVVQRVAALLSVSVLAIDKGRYRTEYSARVKGTRAAWLMKDLRPYMGKRRTSAIDRALAAWRPPVRRLDFEQAEGIRRSFADGDTVSGIAARFGVSRPTIRAVLANRIYRHGVERPWRRPLATLGAGWQELGTGIGELHWLAGWLEGEGSFSAPPPSDPRRPRIAGTSRDADVVAEVAQLLGVSPTKRTDPRGLTRGWSPLFEALLRGKRAVAFMHAVHPLLGSRRQAQIATALDPVPFLCATIERHTTGAN